MYTATILAATLATLASTAIAGNVIITNLCSSDLYFMRAYPGGSDAVVDIPAHGGSYTEALSGSGIALQVWLEAGNSNEVDYSLSTDPTYGGLYYTLSEVNGTPFEATGIELVPGDSACPSVVCTANDGTCDGVNDTNFCEPGTDLYLTTCSG